MGRRGKKLEATFGNIIRIIIPTLDFEVLRMRNDISYMESLEFFLCQGAAKEEEINEAENQLGVRFSEDYRAYLLNYGEVSFGSHELTGICRSERINVVNVTEEAKNSMVVFYQIVM